MKQRFSSLDVQVISHELRSSILNHRLTNIHDLSSRTFQFKFHSSATQTKHILIVDSGFRCHLTNFTRTTASSPSSFVEKLRKCLKTRRVTGVRQVGVDRVLELQFGIVDQTVSKDGALEEKGIPVVGGYRLFFEFFAGGNVILTDAALKIIAVLRIVPEGPNQKKVAKGEDYVITDLSGRKFGYAGEDITSSKIQESLKGYLEKKEQAEIPEEEMKDWQKKKAKKTRKDEGVVRVLAAVFTDFSATLVEHGLLTVGLDPETKVLQVLDDQEVLGKLEKGLKVAQGVLSGIVSSDTAEITGWIIAKKPLPKPVETSSSSDSKKKKQKKTVAFGGSSSNSTSLLKEAEDDLDALLDDPDNPDSSIVPKTDASGFRYDDFHPFLPLQFTEKPHIHTIPIQTYNKTVDSFFSSIESQKLERQTAEKRAVAAKRLANARNEHISKIESLKTAQELHVRKAQAIQESIGRVEEVIDAVNGLIAQGMDWGEIRNLIERERNSGNSVAEVIMDVRFSENIVVIRLYEDEEDDDSEDDDESDLDGEDGDSGEKEREKERVWLDIDIDLSLTAFANARTYYDQKRTAAVKEEKTLQSSAKALKSTEKKIQKDLKQAYKAEKLELRTLRRQGWWEKFYWFKSSEGYLVLGARDPTQADMLYKRFFKKGDVWVHADVQGAVHVLVKNKVEDMKAPIPPGTLSQAGTLAVVGSDAWERKMIISSWWVEWDQVGKIGAGGTVLGTGEFAVKGEKRWLPPAMLVMGFAVGWLMSGGGDEEGAEGDGEDEGAEEIVEELRAATSGQPAGVAQKVEEVEDDDSEDEEFPDAKLESDVEDAAEETADTKPTDGSDDDAEFPDSKLDELDLSDQANPPSQDEDILPPLIPRTRGGPREPENDDEEDSSDNGTPTFRHPPIDRAANASPAPSIASTTVMGTRHLSAKEKRDMKKAKAKGLSLPASALQTPRGSMPPIGRKQLKPSAAPRNLSSKATQQGSQTQNIRGKKGKAKKIAEKYGDQDEEDRLLALKLLGNEKKETERALAGISTAATAGDVEAGSKAEKERLKAREMEEKQLRMKLQAEKVRAQVLADEAVRRDNCEKFLDFEEELDEGMLRMGDLVGRGATAGMAVVPEVKGVGAVERLVDAVPICAPWAALQRFEWKVKLQPGTQKKGKAIREIVDRWGKEVVEKGGRTRRDDIAGGGAGGGSGENSEKVDAAEKGKRQRELVRAWKDAEVVQCVPVGKVKIMMPGVGDEKGGKGGKGAGGKAGGKSGGGGGGGKGSGGKKGKK